jgi:ferredoxin
MTMTMKIEIDQEKCVGAGQCVLAAPKVFDQRDDDGIVVLLDEVPPEEQRAASREAAQLCPAAAITIPED